MRPAFGKTIGYSMEYTPAEYPAVLEAFKSELTPLRIPKLFAIDGIDGCGKSTLSSWLAWRLEIPPVHLDYFVVPDSDPLRWRSEALHQVLSVRLGRMPIIVEGVCVLNILQSIEIKPD